MSVKIRLRRMGRTKTPFYRVVATDSRCATSGNFLETLGWYDPVKAGTNFSLKMDRVAHWTGHGAIMSDTVKSLVRKARKGMGVSTEQTATPAAEPVEEATPAVVPASGPAPDAASEAGEETTAS